MECLRQAATAGDAASQYELGRHYVGGKGMPPDILQAVRWYRLAADSNHLPAINALADLLRTGAAGVPQDYPAALSLSRKGAALGDVEALADLAGMLRKAQGTPRDLPAAARLYRTAADQGYAYAQMMVGWMIIYGELGAPDYVEARWWLEKAADGGDRRAMRELALLYEKGRFNQPDAAQAFVWMEKAAREGDAWAQNRVGFMLRNGAGIEQDDEEAVNWFRLAAEHGEPMGAANLGFHYLYGRGVPRDVTLAFTHLTSATRQLADEWAAGVFVDIFRNASPEEKPVLRALLQACIVDPALTQAKGALPEACAEAIFLLPPRSETSLAQQLLAKLETSGREESLALLAWHSFIGLSVPYDLEKARSLATRATSKDGGFALASIESVAAPLSEARKQASAELHRLANAGHTRAAMLLAHRYAAGLAEEQDFAKALHYYNRAAARRFSPQESSIKQLLARLGIDVEPPPKKAAAVDQPPALSADYPLRPELLFQPHYPYELRLSGLEGKVEVEAIVDESGKVTDVEIVAASHPLFAASAASTVRRWRFLPATKEGTPVASRFAQVLYFHLAPAREEID
ncbi:MAG: TonB family protein [Candidatus Didemnitutus sp.]|nr:TonB family protein [Candidatus Didemnitutus sp.]